MPAACAAPPFPSLTSRSAHHPPVQLLASRQGARLQLAQLALQPRGALAQLLGLPPRARALCGPRVLRVRQPPQRGLQRRARHAAAPPAQRRPRRRPPGRGAAVRARRAPARLCARRCGRSAVVVAAADAHRRRRRVAPLRPLTGGGACTRRCRPCCVRGVLARPRAGSTAVPDVCAARAGRLPAARRVHCWLGSSGLRSYALLLRRSPSAV